MYLTIWSKNEPLRVSCRFTTLSLKLSYLLMLAITECRDWAVLLQKQPTGELKPAPRGHTSRSKKVMECCHVQVKKKDFGSYKGSPSYSTGIDPRPMDYSLISWMHRLQTENTSALSSGWTVTQIASLYDEICWKENTYRDKMAHDCNHMYNIVYRVWTAISWIPDLRTECLLVKNHETSRSPINWPA